MAALTSTTQPLPDFTMTMLEVGGRVGPTGVVKVTATNRETLMKLYRIMQDNLCDKSKRLCVYDRIDDDPNSTALRVDLNLHNKGVSATVIFDTLFKWKQAGQATPFNFDLLNSMDRFPFSAAAIAVEKRILAARAKEAWEKAEKAAAEAEQKAKEEAAANLASTSTASSSSTTA